MKENTVHYFDTTKSVMISSPAGSGKTEKLARRYVSHLLSGSPVEHILAITFTDKAATEMKQRILALLEVEHPSLFSEVREKMPFMRVSTIHSFCLKLLKRFSIELGLDPSLDVMDEFAASTLWHQSIYECLLEERDHPDLFFSSIVKRGIKGWSGLFNIINELHRKRPHPEMIIRNNHPVSGESRELLALYERCLKRYSEKKREKRLIDFNDIELLTYEALVENPQWQNILHAFDEHTDHILVDEFQDTSSLQWQIIDKLTEELRSGIGAKRDQGNTPTIFLVGDDKQSIYLFRGANVELFHRARKKLEEWLRGNFSFHTVRENFRSLPAIVDFVNTLFGRLMSSAPSEPWRIGFTPFTATRQGNGQVELILLDGEDRVRRNREREAAVLARRILSLHGVNEIWDGSTTRPCTFADMAILLRRRTHLTAYEDALRRHGIPFIVVRGIGFYDEWEVALLRDIIFFLVDPLDDYSLFCLLRSPLFGIECEVFLRLSESGREPLFEKLRTIAKGRLARAYRIISSWLDKATTTPFSIMLEDILSETGGWQYFTEPQRRANVKKFIALIEEYESQGCSRLEIREKLLQSRAREEPKAHVNPEGMDAVQIMTIHAAKGLQFPIVFIPALDEDNAPKSTALAVDEDGECITCAYEENARLRKDIRHFTVQCEKEREEEKRLFYVATTRAQDFLCMSAAPKQGKKHAGRLKYVTDHLDHLPMLVVRTESEIETLSSSVRPRETGKPSVPLSAGPRFVQPLPYRPAQQWRDVTEDLDIRTKHGDDWVLLGRVFHMLFEELSKGTTSYRRLTERATVLLKNEVPDAERVAHLVDIVRGDCEKLDAAGYLPRIILQQENAYAELPFILEKDRIVYRGRVDRIIVTNDAAHIYDYKTFPVTQRELPALIDRYRFQMEIYKTAVHRLFSLPTVAFLLFTHMPLCVEM